MKTTNELVQGVLTSNNNLLEILMKYEKSDISKTSIKGQINNNEMAIKLLDL